MPSISPGIPIDIYIPTIEELTGGAYKSGIAQISFTLTNAILATSLLASDLFKEKIPVKKLSTTIGLANIITVPPGGFPMCNGAGVLAAHYKFWARTGGADIMIGTIFVLLSIISTSELLHYSMTRQ
jgi:hypothetical protein